jgi:DNA primase
VVERLKTGEGLWLSEGVTDCLALLSSGRKAIAIPGATLLKPEDVKLLASLREEKKTVFHIFPDKDEAGERLYRQLLNAANEIGACLIRDELPEGCKDFGQWWASQA